MTDVNGQEDVQDKKQKRHDHKHAADLERVTDYIEESELQGKDISNAVNLFADKRNKENEEKLAIEQALQKIHVKKEYIDLIINELETTHAVAEKALRENKGDVVLALTQLMK